MWKYVSRRIRDSFERTYNVLEHHRSWTCGGNGSGEKSSGGTTNTVCSHPEDADRDKQSASVVLAEKLTLCVTPFHHNHSRNQGSSSSSSSSSDDDFRRPPNCEFQQNVLGALTWSSAIVCGWYTSQMICRRRRHLRHEGWAMGRCRFSKTLLSPSQAFHSNLLSHWVLTAPVAPNRATNKWIESSLLSNDGVSLTSKVAQAFPITNVTNDESRLKTLNEVRLYICIWRIIVNNIQLSCATAPTDIRRSATDGHTCCSRSLESGRRHRVPAGRSAHARGAL